MEYLKQTQRPPGAEKGLDLAGKALTPRSERPRGTYGSMLMSVQLLEGRCEQRKCIRHAGHPGACYPSTQAEGG